MPEYALYIDGAVKPITTAEYAAYENHPKGVYRREVVRESDPVFDPLTQFVQSGMTDDGSTLTYTRTAAALAEPVRQAKVRQAAREITNQVDAAQRERVQMEIATLTAHVALGNSLNAAQQTRLTRLRNWAVYWLAVHAEGERLAADPQATPSWPAEPAGGTP